jgi:chemotaxis protein methyltransferase CheR
MDLQPLLNYLQEERCLCFSAYCRPMVERRLEMRQQAVHCNTEATYLEYLALHPEELDCLVDALTINVSSFFRNPLVFEYLAQEILPALIMEKQRHGDSCLRVWSAGCAEGEEPYSVAILIDDLLKKEKDRFEVNVFGTDINARAIQRAHAGVYAQESLKTMRWGFLQEYFTDRKDGFHLSGAIKTHVQFSQQDLLHPLANAPTDSVFGDFDVVLCRNVLIYLESEAQDLVLKKLYRSLAAHGYLILGEAETPPLRYCERFTTVSPECHIFKNNELEWLGNNTT